MENCPDKVRLTELLIAAKREQLKYAMTPEQLELQIKLDSINSKDKIEQKGKTFFILLL